jgi:hypothetical protein
MEQLGPGLPTSSCDAGSVTVRQLPNMRLQRTRSAHFARRRAPLTRGPCGGARKRSLHGTGTWNWRCILQSARSQGACRLVSQTLGRARRTGADVRRFHICRGWRAGGLVCVPSGYLLLRFGPGTVHGQLSRPEPRRHAGPTPSCRGAGYSDPQVLTLARPPPAWGRLLPRRRLGSPLPDTPARLVPALAG